MLFKTEAKPLIRSCLQLRITKCKGNEGIEERVACKNEAIQVKESGKKNAMEGERCRILGFESTDTEILQKKYIRPLK